MKKIGLVVVLLVVAIAAAAVVPVPADARDRYYRHHHRDYDYDRHYDGHYGSPATAVAPNATVPLAAIGGAIGSAFGGTAYIVAGAAIGWLFGDLWESQDAKKPIEVTEWYQDSSGNRWYRTRGVQWRIVSPTTPPPPSGPWSAQP